jgi:molecular chaperone GrpE
MDTKKEDKKEKKKPKMMQEIMEERMKELEEQLKETKAKYLSALAESENMRKRLQKERAEYMRFAKQGIIRDFLTPLDQFEQALGHANNASDEVKNWAFGFQMILSQFSEILGVNQVIPFDSVGKWFDPKKHEAIETVETNEYPDNQIISEFAKGYMIQEMLLRPAKVRVAKHKKLQEEEKVQLKDEKNKGE